MSKTLSLTEALKLATKGPLEVIGRKLTAGPDDYVRETVATFTGGAFSETKEQYVTRALLCHSYNLLPELVEGR